MYSAFFDNGNILYKFSTFIRTAQRERCFYASMQCTPNFFNLNRESQKKFMKSPPTQRERSEPWTIYLPTRPTAQLTASVTSKGLGGHRGRPHEACFDFRGYMASFNLLALKLRPWIGDITRDRQIWICCTKHCIAILCYANRIRFVMILIWKLSSKDAGKVEEENDKKKIVEMTFFSQG